ncbi:MAG: hypothetical protein Tsb005_15030 [Gammaproteobacteria bacterium]
MNEMLYYVEQRLAQWADWTLRYGDFGLGYPKQSTAALVASNSIVAQRHTRGSAYIPVNAHAEAIERMVKELAAQDALLARALRAYYFLPGTLKSKAHAIHCSYSQFKVHVAMAKQWMAGRLSADK